MKHSKDQRLLKTVLCLCLSALASLTSLDVAANGMAPVAINGTQLSVVQLRQLEAQIGTRIAPGNYLVNALGCWVNLTNGTSGCLGQGGSGSSDVHSRYGSGSRDSQGNWNHWSNAAGGAVGGTGDGCVYTSFGWSNC
ncbi:MAG: hypothetical protein AAF648_14745 [Pseudomonadota bacterium]